MRFQLTQILNEITFVDFFANRLVKFLERENFWLKFGTAKKTSLVSPVQLQQISLKHVLFSEHFMGIIVLFNC